MASAPDTRLSGLGSNPDLGHNAEFLGKTLYFHSASPPQEYEKYQKLVSRSPYMTFQNSAVYNYGNSVQESIFQVEIKKINTIKTFLPVFRPSQSVFNKSQIRCCLLYISFLRNNTQRLKFGSRRKVFYCISSPYFQLLNTLGAFLSLLSHIKSSCLTLLYAKAHAMSLGYL